MAEKLKWLTSPVADHAVDQGAAKDQDHQDAAEAAVGAEAEAGLLGDQEVGQVPGVGLQADQDPNLEVQHAVEADLLDQGPALAPVLQETRTIKECA